jgi:hypothetical protein
MLEDVPGQFPARLFGWAADCLVLCGPVLCGLVLCGLVLCGLVLCGLVLCGPVLCSLELCGLVLCGLVLCGLVLCGPVLCSLELCGPVLCASRSCAAEEPGRQDHSQSSMRATKASRRRAGSRPLRRRPVAGSPGGWLRYDSSR